MTIKFSAALKQGTKPLKKPKENKSKVFDFEGSMIPQIEKYFRGFGGELTPYFVLQKNNWMGSTMLKLRKLIKNLVVYENDVYLQAVYF